MGLHLTLMTFKGQCQGHSDFEGLHIINELSLGHMLQLHTTRNHI